jgi:hypothetical protein
MIFNAARAPVHLLLRAAISETLARARRTSFDLSPRVPARPEEDTIMQSTYGSDPKGATS